MAAEIEEERPLVEALRDLVDAMAPIVDVVEELLQPLRELVELVEDEIDLVLRQAAPDGCELEREQAEQRDLRSERLRRCDTDLDAATCVERRVHLARDLRSHHVRDRERARAKLTGELHCV